MTEVYSTAIKERGGAGGEMSDHGYMSWINMSSNQGNERQQMGTTSSASTAYGHPIGREKFSSSNAVGEHGWKSGCLPEERRIGKATGLKVDSDGQMYSFMAFKEDERSMGDVAWGTVELNS